MRYSLRTLLLTTFLIALPLAMYSIYGALWQHHCRALEPSLFRAIIQEEFENAPSLDIDNGDLTELKLDTEFDGGVHDTETDNSIAVKPFEVYLYFSRPGSKVRMRPSKTLLTQIGLDYVRAGDSEIDSNHYFYIRIREWVDWNTVIVDYGSAQGPLYGGGADGVKLQNVDGKWIALEYGSFWIS